jgi:hypothetical protein
MDVLRLDAATAVADLLIDNYVSMIWTERFYGSGDFELRTHQIEKTRADLPQGALVSLRDSDEIMVVHTHNMSRDEAGKPTLIITGRGLDTIMEKRVLLSTVYNVPWATPQLYTPAEYLALLMWNALVNTTGEDPTRPRSDQHIWDTWTAVPNLVVTDSSTISASAIQWWLKSGQSSSRVEELIKLTEYAIRNIRPKNTNADVISFDTSDTVSRGSVIRTYTEGITEMCLDVYNGLDRSLEQTSRPPVVFRWDFDHILSPEYVMSDSSYMNMARISSSIGIFTVYESGAAESIGLDRNILYLDGGDIGDQDPLIFQVALEQKAIAELRKHQQMVYFDGKISAANPYTYGTDYTLGDIVTLSGEFGFSSSMIVSEYIRNEDTSGEQSYPGLVRATWAEDAEGTTRSFLTRAKWSD